MGVTGLWDILAKAGRSESLTSLATIEGFENNVSGKRALRVGIDCSLWYHHAQFAKGGKNPDLRLLFYRILNLLELPIIPLFVFDGRERPREKRGSKKGKAGSHGMTAKFKKMLEVFGIEWRMARGEAEAELSHLNDIGIIDAVMTDDVDALLFGAKMIIRNLSGAASGNMSDPTPDAQGKSNKYHVKVFRADDIKNHPDIGLTKGGMILVALLSGGDYSTGVRGIGSKFAHGLARCGFGDSLIDAYERLGPQNIKDFLPEWRAAINVQLHTNSRELLPSRCPSVILPDDFPDLQVLVNYAHPICSKTSGARGSPMTDKGDISISGLARFCEDHFDEWGYRSKIIDRFRDLVWPAALTRVLRRAALEADEKEKNKRITAGQLGPGGIIRGPLEPSAAEGVGTPATLVQRYLDPVREDLLASAFINKGPQIQQPGPAHPAPAHVQNDHPLIVSVIGYRAHASTDKLPEYRVEVDPKQFVDLAHKGIQDIRDDPGETRDLKKARPEPLELMKVWVPVSVMKHVHPRLVQEYQTAQSEKGAGGRAKKARDVNGSSSQAGKSNSVPQQQAGPSSRTRSPPPLDEIPIEAKSSLPLRPCGFLFTYPNPDNPDFLLSDEEDENHGRTEAVGMPVDPPPHHPGPLRGEDAVVSSAARPTNVRTQRRPPPQLELADIGSRNGVADNEDADPDSEEDGPQSYSAAWADSILFCGGAKSKGKKKATKTTRPRKRTRKSILDDLDQAIDGQAHSPTKRPRSSQSTANAESNSSVARSNNRPIASFPDLQPLEDPTRIRNTYPDSPLGQVYPQASVMAIDSQDDEVVMVSRPERSQKNTGKGKTPMRGRRVYIPPVSSQDSRLGDGFLSDADLVIDLT